jgi:transketolase
VKLNHGGSETQDARLTNLFVSGSESGSMEPITLRIESDTLEEIDDEAEQSDQTRAEYLREVIGNRHRHEQIQAEHEEILRDYEQKVDELETELDRVHNEKRLILEQREENEQLVNYVEAEKTLQERKASANMFTRLKWKVTGVPIEE